MKPQFSIAVGGFGLTMVSVGFYQFTSNGYGTIAAFIGGISFGLMCGGIMALQELD